MNKCADSEYLKKKKPIVLCATKYNNILNQINSNEILKQQQENDKNFMEYLKNGSQELKSKFTGPGIIIPTAQADPIVDNKKKLHQEERYKEDVKLMQKLIAQNEEIRQNKIAKAKEMLQKKEPQNRELESAYILSEVLKVRDNQAHQQIEKRKKEQEKYVYESANQKVNPLIVNGEKRNEDRKHREHDYRSELYNCIQVHTKNRKDIAKNLFEGERRISEQIDQEVRNQIEREKAILQRKKEIMRKNALDAMLMVEQRRQREKQEGEIEDQIINIYNEGKSEIYSIKKQREKQAMQEKQNMIADTAKHLAEITAGKVEAEEARIEKDRREFCIKYDAQEREKIQREKEIKAAKIKQFIEESKRHKAVLEKKKEEFKWQVANRLKNAEVNDHFKQEQYKDNIRKKCEVRDVLLEQMKENKEKKKAQFVGDDVCAPPYADDDKFYFDYANTLIADAEKKQRPIYPILKQVEAYKKHNNINYPQVKVPPHLRCSIPFIDETLPTDKYIKYDLNELKQMNPHN